MISSNYSSAVNNLAKDPYRLQIKNMMNQLVVNFPAFLTSFSHNLVSNWNEEEVFGRMDPIATFQGTRRSIALAFDLPSPNVQVAKDNLSSCNTLASFLYPDYSYKDVGTYTVKKDGKKTNKTVTRSRHMSKPPLVSVRFANLISAGKPTAKNPSSGGQLGYMSGLDWTPALDMGMFRDGNNLFPKVISLSFTLNVLHQGDRGYDGKTLLGPDQGFIWGEK